MWGQGGWGQQGGGQGGGMPRRPFFQGLMQRLSQQPRMQPGANGWGQRPGAAPPPTPQSAPAMPPQQSGMAQLPAPQSGMPFRQPGPQGGAPIIPKREDEMY